MLLEQIPITLQLSTGETHDNLITSFLILMPTKIGIHRSRGLHSSTKILLSSEESGERRNMILRLFTRVTMHMIYSPSLPHSPCLLSTLWPFCFRKLPCFSKSIIYQPFVVFPVEFCCLPSSLSLVYVSMFYLLTAQVPRQIFLVRKLKIFQLFLSQLWCWG